MTSSRMKSDGREESLRDICPINRLETRREGKCSSTKHVSSSRAIFCFTDRSDPTGKYVLLYWLRYFTEYCFASKPGVSTAQVTQHTIQYLTHSECSRYEMHKYETPPHLVQQVRVPTLDVCRQEVMELRGILYGRRASAHDYKGEQTRALDVGDKRARGSLEAFQKTVPDASGVSKLLEEENVVVLRATRESKASIRKRK